MSRFTFIASDYELPDIDLSGRIKLMVKDLKEMNPRPESFWNLDELPDDCEALYIPKGADNGGLQISFCTNPPDETKKYIKKKFIYWLSMGIGFKGTDQFHDYILANIKAGTSIELWSLWFGNDKMDEILQRIFNISDIQSIDFEMFWYTDCCITIVHK